MPLGHCNTAQQFHWVHDLLVSSGQTEEVECICAFSIIILTYFIVHLFNFGGTMGHPLQTVGT